MSMYQLSRMAGPHRCSGNNHGAALIMALMFVVVLALLGATTVTVTTLSSQASGNYKAGIQSFQAAEAGAEEARARLRGNATSQITDAAPTQTTWQAYIGSTAQAQAYGYTGSSQQVRTDSLQTALPYTVVIAHATNAGGHILYGEILPAVGPTSVIRRPEEVSTLSPVTGQSAERIVRYRRR